MSTKFKAGLASFFKLPTEVIDAVFADTATDDQINAANKAILEQSKATVLNDPETAKHFEKTLKPNIFGEMWRKTKELPHYDPSVEVEGDLTATLKNLITRVEANAKKSGNPEPSKDKELEKLQKELNDTKLQLQKTIEQDLPAAVQAKEKEFRQKDMMRTTEALIGKLPNLKVPATAALRILEPDLKEIEVVDQNGKLVPQKGGNLINRMSGAGVYDDYADYLKDLAGRPELGLFAASPGAEAGVKDTPGADGTGAGAGGESGKFTPLPGMQQQGITSNINPLVGPTEVYNRSTAAAEAAQRLASAN